MEQVQGARGTLGRHLIHAQECRDCLPQWAMWSLSCILKGNKSWWMDSSGNGRSHMRKASGKWKRSMWLGQFGGRGGAQPQRSWLASWGRRGAIRGGTHCTCSALHDQGLLSGKLAQPPDGKWVRGKTGPGQEGATVAGFQACDDNSLHQGSSKKDWECKINGT